MTTGIATSKYWIDWDTVISGDGNVITSVNGLLVNCVAGAATGKGYKRKFLPARSGEVVTFSFIARRISGNPQASIDYPVAGTSVAVVDIDSDELQEYSLSFIVPATSDETVHYMQCTVGVFTSSAGACDVTSPRLEVANHIQGFFRIWCAGLINLTRTAGVTTAEVSANFVRCGILAVVWDSPTKTLTVTTLPSINAALSMRPILSAEFTNNLLPSVVAKAGQYNPISGQFSVQFSDGSGTFIDINAAMTDGQVSYLSVWAMGV